MPRKLQLPEGGGCAVPSDRAQLPPADLAGKRGYTPREVARVLRVSPDRVRLWIKQGELSAINTATARCGKPRFVILPHHLAEFEASRRADAPAKPAPRRRRSPAGIDFYPLDNSS
jgi:helix-turn-helix protein